MVTIHYFYDPLCGWCFGATPLVEALRLNSRVELKMYAGGMIQRQVMDASFRSKVKRFDQSIESLTGQQFGEAYKTKIADNETIVLDSYLTAKAIDLVERTQAKGFEMLKAIQNAHFVQAKDTSDIKVLKYLAGKLGISEQEWDKGLEHNAIEQQIEHTQWLMQRWQVTGFPSLLLARKGELIKLPHTDFYGNTQQWNAIVADLCK
ncbi:DsbA family protein [Agarivorans sp. TSD2052]|uniref:DsbA family protein n=1 Tax=Agarivorans sp. TSD2052 TaxID=2937286 RepID=UPI00200C1EE4|nr:DsbA family protein [Agarivorans sp. TSD2052]UPW19845.1 DsbA family protein [Agarivorans sp. TSD2052]